MRIKLLAVESDHARGFLAAVLQGVQAQRRVRRRFGISSNAEDAALFFQVVFIVREFVAVVAVMGERVRGHAPAQYPSH